MQLQAQVQDNRSGGVKHKRSQGRSGEISGDVIRENKGRRKTGKL